MSDGPGFMQRRQPWVPRAMCVQMMTLPVSGMQVPVPPNAFFPEDDDYDAARILCAGCKYNDSCLTAAMEEERGKSETMRFGMRAGLTPAERVAAQE